MRMFRRTLTSRDPVAGEDTVIADCPLPDGSVLHNVWLDCQGINTSQAILTATPYGVGGYILPMTDPAVGATLDVFWDSVVTKDGAFSVNTLDWDEDGSPVTTSEWEVGELQPSQLFDVGSQPKEIFRRREILAAARGRIFDSVNALYFPTFEFKSHLKAKSRISRPSMCLFAFMVPLLDQTTTTVNNTPSPQEWSTIKYITVALENAFIHLLNFVEAGAESPYDTMAGILVDFLEPVILEDTAAAFDNAGTWTIVTSATFEIEVPGDFDNKVLTSG